MQVLSSITFPLIFLIIISLQSAHCSATSFDENVKRSHFPNEFLFGTGTSSYQVEGGYLEDGKGLSNWDVFTHIPGNIKEDENGDIADDHYHQYLEDVDIMHSLGVNAYRFSVSWARILPKGRFGEVNPGGIKFYNNLIDNLLLRGIEPFITIYHHEFPQELQDRYGAWLSPLMQEDFVHFAKVCFESFGDRVKLWGTLNEANLWTDMAYIRGTYPPAHCSVPFGNCSSGNSDIEPLVALHNMLLSHAKAAKLYRYQFQPKQGGSIGIIASALMYEPFRDEESHRQAVTRALAFNAAWMLDPLVFGDYPLEMRQYLGSNLPSFTEAEREYVKGSIDFIGINHYTTLYAKDCLHSTCEFGSDRPIRGFVNTTGERDGIPIGDPTGMSRFFVVPRGMEKIINYVKERYNNMPMYVTENGFSPAAHQNEQVESILEDVQRVNFHKAYLAALARAIQNGADVRGYFVWSLMDNFEWTEGYSMRFGLYYVHRQTQRRIPKLSAKWYQNFLANITTGQNYKKGVGKISSLKRNNNVFVSQSMQNEREEM